MNMKKNLIIALAAAAAFVACNKENTAPVAPIQEDVIGKQVITAVIDDSKAISNQGVLTFAAGELIDIFYSDKSKETIGLTAAMISEDGKSATFEIKGTTTKPFAVYPGVSNTKWTTGDGPKYAIGNKATGLAAGKISGGSLTLTNVCSIVSFSANEVPTGFTFAYLATPGADSVIPSQVQFNFETGEATGANLIKYAFTNVLTNLSDIRFTVFPGEYFNNGFVLTFSKNYGAATEVVGKRLYVNKSLAVPAGAFIKLGNIDNNTVVLGTEAYRTKTLKDGNTWMVENLRYVPEGKTITPLVADAATAYDTEHTGIIYPATFSCASGTAVLTPSSNLKDILEQGLLYTAAVALNGETIPTTDWTNVENTQGICPAGWHIPTAQEWVDLVGACSATAHNNTSAPYYVASLSGASLETLNADGFNFLPYPYINGGNRKYLGSYLNKRADSIYNTYAAMSYFHSSTGRSATQTYAGMITNNNTKSSVNCAYNTLTNAISVRCVKNK